MWKRFLASESKGRPEKWEDWYYTRKEQKRDTTWPRSQRGLKRARLTPKDVKGFAV